METLVCFLNTLSVFLLLRVEERPSYKNIALAGIPIGISALSRGIILVFVPFILIWMVLTLKLKLSTFKKIGFLCLIILLTISPATIRNYLVSGKFVLISANGIVGVWLGNNPYSTAEYSCPPPSYTEKITKRVEEEGEKVYSQEVIKFIKENPKEVAKLYLEKFLFFWSKEEVDNNINTSLQKGYSFIFKFPILLGFGFVAPLGLYGIILSLRRRALLLYLFIFAFMLSMLPFYILSRYRIAFVPILIIFAAFPIWWSYKKIKEKKIPIFLSSLILLLFAIVFVCSQSVIGKLYPLFHHESIVSKKGDRIILRDNSGKWQGGNFITLLPNSSCKKEFLIKEDSLGLKRCSLFFSYQVTKPGTLIFDINGTKGPASLSSTDLMNVGSINLPPSTFHQGYNTITITSEDIEILIPIDSSYTFGRSYIGKNGQWESLKKGELMVWLEAVE
ncbi:MAG: hypothetical protein QME07_00025 [bacterium]|nr:hypothetical protein [bacterium]